MVISSIVAAWADIKATSTLDIQHLETSNAIASLNVGYSWMFANVFCAAVYVLERGRVIKKLKTKDWDSKYRSDPHRCLSLTKTFRSYLLHQSLGHPCSSHWILSCRRLVFRESCKELSPGKPQKSYRRNGVFWCWCRLYLLCKCLVPEGDVVHNLLNGRRTQQASARHRWFGSLQRPSDAGRCFRYLPWACKRACLHLGEDQGETDGQAIPANGEAGR